MTTKNLSHPIKHYILLTQLTKNKKLTLSQITTSKTSSSKQNAKKYRGNAYFN